MGFESKVAGIIKIKVNIVEVLFIGMRSCLREDVIILTVNNQRRWLMFTKIGLKFWIERYVILVVIEHGKLDVVVLRAGQVAQVNFPIVRTDLILAGSRTVSILPLKTL